MFLVLKTVSRSFFSSTKKWICSGSLTLDAAVYNCPWLKTGVSSQTATRFNVCPWTLLIVKEKACASGNCLLRPFNGTFVVSSITRLILGIIILVSGSLAKHAHTNRLLITSRTIKQTPLHKPSAGLRFLSNITSMPFLSTKQCSGTPGTEREFKYSVGNLTWSSQSYTSSAL